MERKIIQHKIYNRAGYTNNRLFTLSTQPKFFMCDAVKDQKKKEKEEYNSIYGELARRSESYNT